MGIVWGFFCLGVAGLAQWHFAKFVNNEPTPLADFISSVIEYPDAGFFPFLYNSSAIAVVVSISAITLYAYLAVKGIRVWDEIDSDSDSERENSWLEISSAIAVPIGYLVYKFSLFYMVWFDNTDPEGLFGFLFLTVAALISIPFIILGFLLGALAPLVVTFFVVYNIPNVFVLLYSLTITSETSKVAERHLALRRPSDVIEAELATALASGLKSDAELNSLINEMAPLPRFLNNLTYRKKAEKYRQMRKLIEAQTEASIERTRMAKSAHELERARRNER